jgi:predicted AlkP superfamily phosphohydrolase/phosphomutase
MRRILALVLDAASPDLIEKWTDDGTLPNLKRLRDGGAYGRLSSVAEFLAEAAPYAFFSGQNPAATGLHFYAMWDQETMQARPPGKDWLPYQPFWRTFQQGGPRALVLDPSNVYSPEPFNGMEIIGWATHDTLAPFQSFPPGIAPWIRRHFGAALLPDERSGLISRHEFIAERDRMLDLNRRFADLCTSLMAREHWDLFLATNVTVHHGGHRLWSTSNVREELSLTERAALEGALQEVYVAADGALGRITEAASPDTVVMVISVHGMAANTSRCLILSEMIRHITGDTPRSDAVLRARGVIPTEWRHAIKSRLPYQVKRGLTRYWRTREHDWTQTKAFNLFSDTQGWIRVNLKGREALGIVGPGTEYEELCEQISEGLRTFVDSDTGEAVVMDTFRPSQVFQGKQAIRLPDIVVRWTETPAALHREVTSPQFGSIAWPTPGRNPEGRSGSHRGQGLLIASGPGIGTGRIENGSILDLAPTILSMLDQPVPTEMEGRLLNLFG